MKSHLGAKHARPHRLRRPGIHAEWFLDYLDQKAQTQANICTSAQALETLDKCALSLRPLNRASDAAKIEERAAQIRSKTSAPKS